MKTAVVLAACLWPAWENVLLRSPLVPPKGLARIGSGQTAGPDALSNASSRASGIAPEGLAGEGHAETQQPAQCASLLHA